MLPAARNVLEKLVVSDQAVISLVTIQQFLWDLYLFCHETLVSASRFSSPLPKAGQHPANG